MLSAFFYSSFRVFQNESLSQSSFNHSKLAQGFLNCIIFLFLISKTPNYIKYLLQQNKNAFLLAHLLLIKVSLSRKSKYNCSDNYRDKLRRACLSSSNLYSLKTEWWLGLLKLQKETKSSNGLYSQINTVNKFISSQQFGPTLLKNHNPDIAFVLVC
jgi:hypothetical protein